MPMKNYKIQSHLKPKINKTWEIYIMDAVKVSLIDEDLINLEPKIIVSSIHRVHFICWLKLFRFIL